MKLKPGYNVQFAVNSGFITGIGVFSNRTDFGTLIPFLTYLWHKHGKSYRNVVADSGYESLANYRWLFENGQTAFIKPANYESGKKRSSKEQVGRMENMGYYEPDDCFICKNGRHLDLSSHYTSHAKVRGKAEYCLSGIRRFPVKSSPSGWPSAASVCAPGCTAHRLRIGRPVRWTAVRCALLSGRSILVQKCAIFAPQFLRF